MAKANDILRNSVPLSKDFEPLTTKIMAKILKEFFRKLHSSADVAE